MKDYIITAVSGNEEIRAFAAVTTQMVEEAHRRHGTYPVATAALGRLLTAGAMMGIMMKGYDDLLTLQIKGEGPIGKITVTADSHGNVKGYADNPFVDLPAKGPGKLDVGAAVGKGELTVIKDLGLKDPYIGTVDLVSGEIAQDLTYYFVTSEQVPSAVGLGVLLKKEDASVDVSGGFIVQLMPGASEETISRLEANVAKISSVTKLLAEGHTPESLLEVVLDGFDIVYTGKSPTQFHCNCDKQRVAKALITIGPKELQSLIDEGKPAELNCHFCNSHYLFSVEELEELLALARG